MGGWGERGYRGEGGRGQGGGGSNFEKVPKS
jgi:hypothetical protein